MSHSRNPDLAEVLSAALDSRMGQIHTAMPGRIESYDHSSQKAKVKPLTKNVEIPEEGSEIVDDFPIINDVPVIIPRSENFFLSFNVKPGDLVLLVFCERSIDEWVHGTGGVVEPADPRRHSLSDAVCIPGLFTFQKPLKNSGTDGVKIGEDFDSGMRLEIANGIMQVTLGNIAEFSPMMSENFQIWWATVLIYLTAMAASITALGGNPPAPPPPFDPSIASQKVKIPG